MYWDFCVDDHGKYDVSAMVEKILSVKRLERSRCRCRRCKDNTLKFGAKGDCDVEITAFAHSMGAASLLIYLVTRGLEERPHHLSRAVLLSPAGYHKTIPLLCRVLGPLINIFLRFGGDYLLGSQLTLRKNKVFRYVVTKVLQDVRSSSAPSSLLVTLISLVLGGAAPVNARTGTGVVWGVSHPFTAIHNLVYNTTASATSTRVYKQFWQMWSHGRFEAYDYGSAVINSVRYGTSDGRPLNYMEHYDVIDIPVHFAMGMQDALIEPVSVIHHYKTMLAAHPGGNPPTSLKPFPDAGHIELVLLLPDDSIKWMLGA